MVFTDPPYGMNLDTDYTKIRGSDKAIDKGGGRKYKPVIADDKPFDPSFIPELAPEVFMWGGDYYHHRLPEGGSWIVWDKRGSTEADKIIGSSFELCWSKQKHKRDIARILWMGSFGDKEARQRVHPTQKPTSLVCWFFDRWGKDKPNIVDLFLGSGSTLIACEKTNRKCFGMEIDPHYCQVIIDRWEQYTESQATLIHRD
jgi:site-specific DNA-methyltransferase (adenine-specific)